VTDTKGQETHNSKRELAAKRWRWGARLIALAVGLGLSACGGGSATPGVASTGSNQTTTSAPSGLAASPSPSRGVTPRMLEFTQCMRTHGVPDYPEPIAPPSHPQSGLHFLGNGPNPNASPRYQAASAACRKYAVASPVTPAVAVAVQAEQLRYANCMRSHGLTDYPDPNSNGQMPSSGISPQSPAYRAAETACRDLLPGLPGLPRTGRS
jgi:hypothetical protein